MADLLTKALNAFKVTANSRVELQKQLEEAAPDIKDLINQLLSKYIPRKELPLAKVDVQVVLPLEGKLWQNTPAEAALQEAARKEMEEGPNLLKDPFHQRLKKENEQKKKLLEEQKEEKKLLKEMRLLEKSLGKRKKPKEPL